MAKKTLVFNEVARKGLEPSRPKSAGPQPTASTIPPHTHYLYSITTLLKFPQDIVSTIPPHSH